jgi:hypothetical protein
LTAYDAAQAPEPLSDEEIVAIYDYWLRPPHDGEAVAVLRLIATIASLRQRVEELERENETILGMYIAAEAEVQRLRGEVERLTPVVEAAKQLEPWAHEVKNARPIRRILEALAALHPPVGEPE